MNFNKFPRISTNFKKDKGIAALVTVLSLGTLIFIISLSTTILAFWSIKNVGAGQSGLKAYYAAYSGIQDGLIKLGRNKDFTGNFSLGVYKTNDVSVTVTFYDNQAKITSSSTFSQINKELRTVVDINATTGLIAPISTTELAFISNTTTTTEPPETTTTTEPPETTTTTEPPETTTTTEPPTTTTTEPPTTTTTIVTFMEENYDPEDPNPPDSFGMELWKNGYTYEDVYEATEANNWAIPITMGQYYNSDVDVYVIDRGFVYINTGALPEDAEIISAYLELYFSYNPNRTYNFDIIVQNGQPDHPLWGDIDEYNKNYYSGNGGSFDTSVVTEDGYQKIYLNAQGISWINQSMDPNENKWTILALRTAEEIAGIEPPDTSVEMACITAHSGIGDDWPMFPKLVVTYSLTEPPTTTTTTTEPPTTTTTTTEPPGFACGDTLTDSRDDKTYPTVLIGSQCWMAKNLDHDDGCTQVTWVNGSDEGCCGYYTGGPFTDEGLLYQWSAAMNGSTVEGAQGICPSGWHIPSHDGWTDLERHICSDIGNTECETTFPKDTTSTGYKGAGEGSAMATNSTLWDDNVLETDPDFSSSGLDIIPAGYRLSTTGSYTGRGNNDTFWSSTEYAGTGAWRRNVYTGNTGVLRHKNYIKSYGFSVRCLKD